MARQDTLKPLRDRVRLPMRALFVGLRDELLEDARVFVLPNPSGRNANYTYAEMLAAFTSLRALLASDPRR